MWSETKSNTARVRALLIGALLLYWGSPDRASLEASGAADSTHERRVISSALRITAYDFPVTENLDIAARTIGRFRLAPGQTFSLNQVLGRRTADKGYRKARAYAGGGRDVQEIGGGLCMLSTVLYALFLRAGLEIVERHPHQRTVGYAQAGFDATVNYPHKNLVVRNNKESPVEFTVQRRGRSLRAELEGLFHPQTEIRLERSVSRAVIPGRIENGFRVRTTRTFLLGGMPERAEVLSFDVFAAIDQGREE